jgi:TfoX/Sxy family transcriptional regulator of competence genes
MTQSYLEHLSQMVNGLEPLQIRGVTIEFRHFFSGALLYVNGKIYALFSPASFALKLPGTKRQSLIHDGIGEEFRFSQWVDQALVCGAA